MKQQGLVKAATLEPFIRFLRNHGVNLDPHLERANIPAGLISQQDSWIPKQQVYGFLSDVATANEMETLGLMVGEQICVADLGDLGKEIYRCRTLYMACKRFAALIPKFAQGNVASVQTRGSKIWFTYRTTDHSRGNRDHADHYGMMMLLSVVRLVAEHWVPTEAVIQTGPCDAFGRHPAWKNTRVEFNADATGFAFPASWRTRPIPKPPANIETDQQIEYASNPPETLSRSLEIILTAYANIGGIPTLDKVAASLNMSERTVKRRLAEEGATYRNLVDRVRIRAAEKFLSDPKITVKEIARVLGYSGPNNFIRAFQRITGCTPGDYRRRFRT